MALSLHRICRDMIPLEIESTTKDIKAALWAGDVELAKVLISKRMGLRICGGARETKLRATSAGGPNLA